MRIAIGRAILAPEARIASPAAESLLLAVEAGHLGIPGGEELPILAGGGIVSAAGSVHEFRNAGDGLLVRTIAPVSR